jgi:hypothetical protein
MSNKIIELYGLLLNGKNRVIDISRIYLSIGIKIYAIYLSHKPSLRYNYVIYLRDDGR